MKDMRITVERLRELLEYDPDAGVFTWIRPTNAIARKPLPGTRAGSIRSDGYRYVGIDGRQHAEHRLVFLYMTGEWPVVVDHRDGVPTNNRWANLRDTSRSINAQNLRGATSRSSTGLLGAYRFKERFRSTIAIGKRRVFLGEFETAEAAHEAYMAAKRIYHAEAIGTDAMLKARSASHG